MHSSEGAIASSRDDVDLTSLAINSPWLGGFEDSWWLVRFTGSGSFRPCDYVDPDRKGTRRCLPIVHFNVDVSDWAWVYYGDDGNGNWPWPWQPSMLCEGLL